MPSTTLFPGVPTSVCPGASTAGVVEGAGWSTACACFIPFTVSGPAVGLAAAFAMPWPSIAASVVGVAPWSTGDGSAFSMAAGFIASAISLAGGEEAEDVMSDWTWLAESAALFASTQVDEHGGLPAAGWSTACACFIPFTVSGPAVGSAAAFTAPWPGIAASVVGVALWPSGDASASSMAAGFAATAARLGGSGQSEGIMTTWMFGSDWTRLAELAALFARTQVDEHGGLHAGSTLWEAPIAILSDAVRGARSDKCKKMMSKKESMVTLRSNWTQ